MVPPENFEEITERQPPQPLSAIIFDLDGTLIDSRTDLATSLNYALQHFGCGRLPLEQVVAMIGGGAPRLVERALAAVHATGASRNDVLAVFYDHYRDHSLVHTEFYPHARELLNRLSELAIPCALVSNKPLEFTRSMVLELGIAHHFSPIFGGDSFATKKPDPEPLHAALQQIGVAAQHAAMVGDSETDMGAAVNAGAYALGVTFGFRDRATLIESGADRLISDLSQLTSALGI